MKTYITLRQIKNLTQKALNASLDHDYEQVRVHRDKIRFLVLNQIAFGISTDNKLLAFEALRVETIRMY